MKMDINVKLLFANNSYLEDEFIVNCLTASTCNNSKRLLEKISFEDFNEMNLDDAWTKNLEILEDDRLTPREQLRLSMDIAKGAMIIRKERVKHMKNRYTTFVEHMERIESSFRKYKDDGEVTAIHVPKVKEVTDIGELNFYQTPDDLYLLQEDEEMLHTGRRSDTSDSVTFAVDMLADFEKYFSVRTAEHQVPEGKQVQEEEHEDQQVPQEEQQIRKEESLILQTEQEVPVGEVFPEVESHFELVIETGPAPYSGTPLENIQPNIDEIPGTPSKRLRSRICGDDTPSKRRRLTSLGFGAENELELEGSNQQEVLATSLLEYVDVTRGSQTRASPQAEADQEQQAPELEEQIPVSPSLRGKIRGPVSHGNIQLIDKWLKNFSKRTEMRMTLSILDDLREWEPTSPLPPEILFRSPGFTIVNEHLRTLFDQNFEDVSFIVEQQCDHDDVSSERSAQSVERQEPRRPESEAEGLDFVLSRQEDEQDTNALEETEGNRESMKRMSIPGFENENLHVTPPVSPPQAPHLTREDTTAEDLFQQDYSFPTNAQGVQGAQEDQEEIEFPIDKYPDQLSHERFIEDNQESIESDTDTVQAEMEVTEETILASILNRLSSVQGDYIDLEEIITPNLHSKRTAAWSFNFTLHLTKKKKIRIFQNGSGNPIYVSRYIRK